MVVDVQEEHVDQMNVLSELADDEEVEVELYCLRLGDQGEEM